MYNITHTKLYNVKKVIFLVKSEKKHCRLIRLENYLMNYYITGGMPEVVKKWCDTKDINKIEAIQQKILDSYELDFAKYAPSNDFPKLSAIWRSIPEQLARENSKFIFGQVKKGLRAKNIRADNFDIATNGQ